MTRLAQEGKGSSTDARETNDVDIKDAMPLLVTVRGDVTLGADPGVIDDDVESAEVFGDQSDGGVDLVRIDNVCLLYTSRCV